MEVHIGAILEVMQEQKQESQEFPSPPMQEETTTIPWNGENVEHNYVHNFANKSSSVTGEEVGEKETNDEVKESRPNEHVDGRQTLPRPNRI
ncbi:hypothetical protein QYF36_011513 [Acer negundo]|nr:hypothetical protein QYF36_011513 [Acer negundo]